MIDQVRNTALSILNKENQGYITPLQFNLYAHNAQMDIFTELFGDYGKALNKRNRGLGASGHADQTTIISEVIDRFEYPALLTFNNITQAFEYPSDAFKLNLIYIISSEVELDYVSHSSALALNRSHDSVPTLDFPVYTIFDNGGSKYIKPYPTTINAGVPLRAIYIRYPKTPKWTYQGLQGGEPAFNPSALDYQDFELPQSYMYELVVRILKMCGLEISREEVVNFSRQEEATKKQEDML